MLLTYLGNCCPYYLLIYS
nr:unnamed protein product [Callosobruchus chinensis]